MRRTIGVDVDDLVRSLTLSAEDDDELTARILDAAAELFTTHGVRRCSVEDIAARSGLGRTTVYRRFPGRAQIVTAVLTRECRRFFTAILLATAHLEREQDMVVEGFLAGLRSAEATRLSALVRTEPELLSLLTVDSGTVVAVARDLLVAAFGPVADDDTGRRVALTAEVLVRLAISFVVEGRSLLDPGDEERARADLHALLGPLVEPLAEARLSARRTR